MGPGCNPKILEGGTLLIEGLELVFRPLHLMRIAHPATDMVLLTDEVSLLKPARAKAHRTSSLS